MTTFDILLKIDQVVFQVITLGRAKKGETISAAAYRGEQMGLWTGTFFRPVIDFLLCWIGPQPHCKQAYEWQKELYK
jgi:hypothetical protein